MLPAQKIKDCTGQFRHWKRFEQDVADSQYPGPFADFCGGVPGDQHKMTLPVLADGIEHLKPFHIGQAVIEHHHIGCEIVSFSDSLCTVVSYSDIQRLRLQVTLEVFRQQLFVVDNQYFV